MRVGTADALPWPDDAFDLVVGLQSFFFGGDAAALLREAARVARPGATVVVQVPGPRAPRPRGGTHPRPAADARPAAGARPWREGALEAPAGAAGLTPECAFDTSWAYEFADAATAGRAMLAAARHRRRAPGRPCGGTFVQGLERFRTPAGGYQLFNTYRYLVARAT